MIPQPKSAALKHGHDLRAMRELFAKADLRPTVARLRIMSCLSASPSPLAMEDILRLLLEMDTYIQASTVYRGLNDLHAKGLIRRNWVNGAHRARAMYFPVDVEQEQADVHLLMCRRCGQTKTFTDSGLRAHLMMITNISALNDPRQSLTISIDCLGCSAGAASCGGLMQDGSPGKPPKPATAG